MTSTYLLRLPEHIERFYGVFNTRLVGAVYDVGVAVADTHYTLAHRRDAEEEENKSQGEWILAALIALGLSLETLVDEARLRQALRRMATMTDLHAKRQIAEALGRAINVPVPHGAIDRWIEHQVGRIRDIVNRWFSLVERDLPSATRPTEVDVTETIVAMAGHKEQAKRSAFAAAAAGLLLLNAELVAENAVNAGVQTYIWRTKRDERVRDHHAALEGTLQNFRNPPMGGGTNEDQTGNPGDGFRCRCVHELIIV